MPTVVAGDQLIGELLRRVQRKKQFRHIASKVSSQPADPAGPSQSTPAITREWIRDVKGV
jgi:hypothetical protein